MIFIPTTVNGKKLSQEFLNEMYNNFIAEFNSQGYHIRAERMAQDNIKVIVEDHYRMIAKGENSKLDAETIDYLKENGFYEPVFQ